MKIRSINKDLTLVLCITIYNKGSSDCPVTDADPFLELYFSVSHKDLNGKEMPDWVKRERIGIKEALKIFTEDASYALHENKGKIEEGMLADFIVLLENPLQLTLEQILSLRVLQTYLGGELVVSKQPSP